MTIYRLYQLDGYDFLNDAHGLKLSNYFRDRERTGDLEAVVRDWQPAEVKVEDRYVGNGPRQLARSDLWAMNSPRLALTQAAAAALDEFLRSTGALLPLLANDSRDLLLHNTQEVDCLDYERSDIMRFKSGRIMLIVKPVFRRDRVEGHDIFRLPDGGAMTFVSDRFARAVKDHGLRGLDFRLCQVV